MRSDILLKELQKNGIEYKEEFALKNACTFRIGGACRLAVFPKNTNELAQTIILTDMHELEYFICGKGSNTLFCDGYIDKIIIFTNNCNKLVINNDLAIAASGVGLIHLAGIVADNGLSGLEFASGIPGSVGGSVYMNAGAYGSCIADVVTKSKALNRISGEIITVTEHEFDYRSSIYKSNKSLVCLEAEFKLFSADNKAVRQKMRELSVKRRSKQPLEFPSAGSYFKRPLDNFAGKLIEDCGLKGTRIGDAEVSEKHAGFIINRGNASFSDVMQLEELVRQKVLSTYGIELEREVEIIK